MPSFLNKIVTATANGALCAIVATSTLAQETAPEPPALTAKITACKDLKAGVEYMIQSHLENQLIVADLMAAQGDYVMAALKHSDAALTEKVNSNSVKLKGFKAFEIERIVETAKSVQAVCPEIFSQE